MSGLGTIAPWLQLPNFQQAAEAGARIGLQQRTSAEEAALARANLEEQSKLKREQMASAAAEAAGKLGLDYAQLGVEGKKVDNERAIADATLKLRGGHYSDINEQADQRHQLGEDRLQATKENRNVVNDFHDRSLDATVQNRTAVNALRDRGLNISQDRLDLATNVQNDKQLSQEEKDAAAAAYLQDRQSGLSPLDALNRNPAAKDSRLVNADFNGFNTAERQNNRPASAPRVTVKTPYGHTVSGIPGDPRFIKALGTNAPEDIDIKGEPTAPTIAPVPLTQTKGKPLPKSKDALVKDEIYQTAKGDATWNGTRFVQ